MTCRFSSVGPTRVLASVSVVSRFRRWSSLRLNTIPNPQQCLFRIRGAVLSQDTRDLAALLFCFGGCGLRSVVTYRAAARWASWADCLQIPCSRGCSGARVGSCRRQQRIAVRPFSILVLQHPGVTEGHPRVSAKVGRFGNEPGRPCLRVATRRCWQCGGFLLLSHGGATFISCAVCSSLPKRSFLWVAVHRLLHLLLSGVRRAALRGSLLTPSPASSSSLVSFLQVWRVLDFLGHHRAACATAGVLG